MKKPFLKIRGGTVFSLESVVMIVDSVGLAIVYLDSGDKVATFMKTEDFQALMESSGIMGKFIDTTLNQ